MVDIVWTITASYGLSVFDISQFSVQNEDGSVTSVTETDIVYFAERKVSKKYDSIGMQFKGTPINVSGGPVLGYLTVTETDKNGKKYSVQYVADNSAGTGYHVWRSKPYDEDTENWDNASVYLKYEEKEYGSKLDNPGVITNIQSQNKTTDEVAVDYFNASFGYDIDVESITDFAPIWSKETEGTEFFNSRAILGIFGIPYQFMPHVDPRIDYTNAGKSQYLTQYNGIGREFANFIVENMPILLISPGLPNFMTNFTNAERQSILGAMKSLAGNLLDGSINTSDLLNNSGKYYTFEYAVTDFYNYCNPACRIAAAYMGVTDKQIDGVYADKVNWMSYTTKTLSKIFSTVADVTTYASIPFYIESDSQISESFSNDTTESSLNSAIDTISSFGREAMFILGYSNAATNAGIDILAGMNDPNQVKEEFANMFGPLAQGNGFIANILNHLTSVATGGKLIFPKIWSDSSFSRSYDVTIKLRSPDMDNFSLYCNIIVPYLHLLCMMLPRQIEDNPNAFYSPFLVRAIYKGFFNVDMGIITSMSVTKGDSGQWNADGIPCAIDVNLTIADLYDNISMTHTTATNFKYDTMDNTGFMDYIANLCSINIYTPEVGRTIRMWFINNFTNRATDVINIGLWGNIQNSLANGITNVWRHSSL